MRKRTRHRMAVYSVVWFWALDGRNRIGDKQYLEWRHSTLLGRDLAGSIAALKAQPGKDIGVHGSISLVQSLLLAGLLDELPFIQFPAIAGHGRRLLDQPGAARQLDLRYSRATPTGLNYL